MRTIPLVFLRKYNRMTYVCEDKKNEMSHELYVCVCVGIGVSDKGFWDLGGGGK